MKSDTPRTDSQIDEDAVEMMNIRYGRMIQHARSLEREINSIQKAVDKTGTAIGSESEKYTTEQRIGHVAQQRDYFMRETDKARALAAVSNDPDQRPGKQPKP